MMAKAKIILRIGLSLTAFFFMARCTEEYVDVKSAGTTIKLLENGRNLNGAPINFSKNADGTYQYYYIDSDVVVGEPFLSRILLDADGNFILKTQPKNETRSETTSVELIGPQVLEITGAQNVFDTVSWTAQRDFTVELRFGPGKKQKAHRFVVPYGSTADDIYLFQDYVDVPFEAWDVTNNRQLMVSFRDQGNDTEFNLVHYDTTGPAASQSREYIVIHYIEYNPLWPIVFCNCDYFRSNEAFFIWPYLPQSGVWDPTSLPAASVKIYHRSESFAIEYRPLQNAWGTDISVRSDNNECVAYSSANRSTYQVNGQSCELSTITIFDQNWNVKTSKIVYNTVSGYFVTDGKMYATQDGGILLFSGIKDEIYGLDQFKVKFTRLNSDLTMAYEHSFYWYDFVRQFGLFNVQDYYLVRFMEKEGRNYFLLDDYAEGIILFEMNAAGITKLGKLNFPDIDLINIATVVSVGNKFAAVQSNINVIDANNGNVYLFDESLAAPYVITPANLGVQQALESVPPVVSIYNVEGTLYFTVFLDDPFNQITRSPKFIIGRIDPGGNVTFKEHELGSNIRSATSVFSGDGTGVHLVQVQSSTAVTDLLLFKTNELFEIK